jgi:DNA-binding transcriptional regulator YhcF (GntR family)
MNQTNERVERLYQYIKDCWQTHRKIPTVREMAADCDLSLATVSDYLSKLEAQGRILRDRYKSRSIRLVEVAPHDDANAEKVYQYIRDALEDGTVPSQTEIAEACYLSRREVRRCIVWLEVQGKIERGTGQRGLRLVENSPTPK